MMTSVKYRLLSFTLIAIAIASLIFTQRDRWKTDPRLELLDQGQSIPALEMKQASDSSMKLKSGGVARYTESFYRRFRPLVGRKADSRDPEVIRLIREIIDSPSESPVIKQSHPILETPQAAEVQAVHNKKRGGFYIECGALDGERSSNTIHLESSYGWTGLLVEMDPYFYTQLLGKARKSWTINACLSPHPYVTELEYIESSGGLGKVEVDREADTRSRTITPCFPLESILLALNQTHVNYFSLDVEGVELNILKTIPFDRMTIDTLSVEYRHGAEAKQNILEFMERNNFRMHKDIKYDDLAHSLFVEDFIFVRKSLT